MTTKRRTRKARGRRRATPAARGALWSRPWAHPAGVPAALVLLALLTLTVYGNAIGNGFVFDDHALVLENTRIRSLANIPDIMGFGDARQSYRPVRFVSYTIDHLFFGLDPRGYHFFNLVYHFIAAFMVYLVARRLAGSAAIALFAALLFTVHPVQADSVTYVSGRRDILSTVFYLLAFYYFLRYREGSQARYVPAILGLFVLGLLTKEMVVTLPVMFFAYDFYTRFRIDEARLGLGTLRAIPATAVSVVARYRYFYLPMIALAAAFLVQKLFISNPSRAEGFLADSYFLHLLTILKIQLGYLQLLLFPVTLKGDYAGEVSVVTSALDPMVYLALGVFAVIGVGLVKAAQREKVVMFVALWYIVTMLPVSQIVPHHEPMAEHYLYLPFVGVALLAATGFQRLVTWPRVRPYAYAAGGVLLVLLSTRTAIRNLDWRDDMTFWEKTLETAPGSVRARYNLGLIYDRQGDLATAVGYYEDAIRLDPSRSHIHNNLGTAYAKLGSLTQAVTEFREAVRLRPEEIETHLNLSRALRLTGSLDEAIETLQVAVELHPESAQAQHDLGTTYQDKGLVEQARQQYLRAVEIDPAHVEAHMSLAAVLQREGDQSGAVRGYESALSVQPDHVEAHLMLGRLYVTLDDDENALEHLRLVTTLAPNHPQVEAVKELISSIADRRKQ